MPALTIKIKKGLNISLTGEPIGESDQAKEVKKVALVVSDYVGLKPKLLVQVGQEVGLGQVLFVNKKDPSVKFVSPGTGRIVAINRVRRRQLQSVVIELDDKMISETVFETNRLLEKQSLRDVLLKSGLWTGFRTRPFDQVAISTSSPSSIFVTAIDTRPLAPDPNLIIANRESEFVKGMDIIRQLGDWPLYLCTGPKWSGPQFSDEQIKTVEFDGPHPAGLAGTHIHYLDPVSIDHNVWHISYQDVIAIGHLFQTGRILTERIVSLAGSVVNNPRILKTRIGADIMELVNNEMPDNCRCRILSGSVLDGLEIGQTGGFLGRYHNQISIIPDSINTKKFNWFAPLIKLYRANGIFSSAQDKKDFNTACNGRSSAMIPVEAFDRIMPLDILLSPLLRAILVKDTVTAQNLGCLELVEEDLALSSFICPAKQDYGIVLRKNLNQIEMDG